MFEQRREWVKAAGERAEALLLAGKVKPGGLKQIEAAKVDGRWAAAYPPASRMEVRADLTAALEGGERYSVLYRLHQVQGAEKRRAAVAKVVALHGGNRPYKQS